MDRDQHVEEGGTVLIHVCINHVNRQRNTGIETFKTTLSEQIQNERDTYYIDIVGLEKISM